MGGTVGRWWRRALVMALVLGAVASLVPGAPDASGQVVSTVTPTVAANVGASANLVAATAIPTQGAGITPSTAAAAMAGVQGGIGKRHGPLSTEWNRLATGKRRIGTIGPLKSSL